MSTRQSSVGVAISMTQARYLINTYSFEVELKMKIRNILISKCLLNHVRIRNTPTVSFGYLTLRFITSSLTSCSSTNGAYTSTGGNSRNMYKCENQSFHHIPQFRIRLRNSIIRSKFTKQPKPGTVQPKITSLKFLYSHGHI